MNISYRRETIVTILDKFVNKNSETLTGPLKTLLKLRHSKSQH